jgi:hypothetical protein
MLRTLTTAAILALTVSAVQAETLSDRIHAAAVEACATESSAALPLSHYNAISKACVLRISATATAKYQAQADARTLASTASVAGN